MSWRHNRLIRLRTLPSRPIIMLTYLNFEHYTDVIMGTIASQITSLLIVYLTVHSDVDQRKNQSFVSLAFVRGIHRGPVVFPHNWPVTRKRFPFDDVIMKRRNIISSSESDCQGATIYPQLEETRYCFDSTWSAQNAGNNTRATCCRMRDNENTVSLMAGKDQRVPGMQCAQVYGPYCLCLDDEPRDKMAAILQTVFSQTFSWIKNVWITFIF